MLVAAEAVVMVEVAVGRAVEAAVAHTTAGLPRSPALRDQMGVRAAARAVRPILRGPVP